VASGANDLCLDVLRALARAPEALEAYWSEVDLAAGADRHLDDAALRLRKELADLDAAEVRARRLVELLAVVFCGSLLVRHAPAAVSDAYTASRLGGDAGRAFGTLPPGVDTSTIIERARPQLP
jgi:putative acyl-CoA dehydrogenase